MNAAQRRVVGFLRGCRQRLAAFLVVTAAVTVAATLPWAGFTAPVEAADVPAVQLAQTKFVPTSGFVFRSVTWELVVGTARDIAIGANGSVFKTGLDGSVSKWNNDRRNWDRFSSPGDNRLIRIAVDPQGLPWVVDENNAIHRYDGKSWVLMNGFARDIAIGGGGEVFVISRLNNPFSWSVKEKKWQRLEGLEEGSGRRIAVEPNGFPWMVGNVGQIWRHDGSNWISISGTARDISVGPDGTVMITGTDGSPRRWNRKKQGWEKMLKEGENISVGPRGSPWMVDETGVIFASRFFKEDEGKERQRRTARGGATIATITSDDPIKFVKVKGAATDIGIGADGSVFIVGIESDVGRWSNRRQVFLPFPGDLSRISVDPDGNPWGINRDGEVFRHQDKRWTHVKGVSDAVDLGVGGDGTVFVTTAARRIYKWDPDKDKLIFLKGQKGERIDVSRRGDPWVIDRNKIFRLERGAFIQVKRRAIDIGVGPDDSVFMISTTNRLFQWNYQKNDWDRISGVPGGKLEAVDVGPGGRPWIANTKQEVFSAGFFDRDENVDLEVARGTATTTTIIPTKPPTITFTKTTSWQAVPLIPENDPGVTVFDIGIGANGDVLAVVNDLAVTNAWKFDPGANSWEAHTDASVFSFRRIDVDPDGFPWFVTTGFTVGRFVGTTFVNIANTALDIGVGADGSVFIVDGTGTISKWNEAKSQFESFNSTFSGLGRFIDVDPNGRPWVINTVFDVYQFDGTAWIRRPGVKAQDIAIGANGSVYVGGTDSKPYKWNATSKIWDKLTNFADRVAVTPNGKVWIGNTSDGKVFFAR